MRIKMKGKEWLRIHQAVKATTWEEALMELKEDRWLIKAADPAQAIMVAVLVPRRSMTEYEKGDRNKLGFDLGKIETFIDDPEEDLDFYMEDNYIQLDQGRSHASIAHIVIEDIESKVPGAPDIEHEVHIKNESTEFLHNFIDKADDMLTTGHYYIGARDDGIYLYASGDVGQIDDFYPWEDFDDYEIDWSINNSPASGGNVPEETHAIDTIQSIDWSMEMPFRDRDIMEGGTLSLGNHIPTKLLLDTSDSKQDGVMMSFFQMPRIDENDANKIPDKVINSYPR